MALGMLSDGKGGEDAIVSLLIRDQIDGSKSRWPPAKKQEMKLRDNNCPDASASSYSRYRTLGPVLGQ